MSYTPKLEKSSGGQLIQEEHHIDVGSSSFQLRHDTIVDDADFDIWTDQNDSGTQLTSDDYSFEKDTGLVDDAGNAVYKEIQITNSTYQTGDLYFDYNTIGDFTEAKDINRLTVGFIEAPVNPVYIDNSTFEIAEDWTSELTGKRRLEIELDASTVYTEVVSSSYDSGTDRTTVNLDDAVIDSTIESFRYGAPQPAQNLIQLAAKNTDFDDSNFGADTAAVSTVAEALNLLGADTIVEHNFDITDPSNGYYVRWENGLQICFHEIQLSYYESIRLRNVWNFPTSFSEIPYSFQTTFGSIKQSAAPNDEEVSFVRIDTATASKDSMTYNFYRISGGTDFVDGDTAQLFVLSIGRWK